ncbi:unnamed protein product [Prunus armeniaca]|uniref:Uncharacterized protein n=1 Tax=Prunus armeniaca TaxID=36596 RepID=A0A6J5TWP5_PRUAR|nr:unnamed protein product [Prunus armeniaca]
MSSQKAAYLRDYVDAVSDNVNLVFMNFYLMVKTLHLNSSLKQVFLYMQTIHVASFLLIIVSRKENAMKILVAFMLIASMFPQSGCPKYQVFII